MWRGLLVFLVLTFAFAGIGGAVTGPALETWYPALEKPAWNPPNWVFGPVWSFLYLTMAVAAWLVWRKRGLAAARVPLLLFLLQLMLNAAWSGLFFGLHLPAAAFVDLVLLWLAIFATILAFRRSVALAGWLLTPYLAWVTYAGTLNLAIWLANP